MTFFWFGMRSSLQCTGKQTHLCEPSLPLVSSRKGAACGRVPKGALAYLFLFLTRAGSWTIGGGRLEGGLRGDCRNEVH